MSGTVVYASNGRIGKRSRANMLRGRCSAVTAEVGRVRNAAAIEAGRNGLNGDVSGHAAEGNGPPGHAVSPIQDLVSNRSSALITSPDSADRSAILVLMSDLRTALSCCVTKR
jgi:hypothetical protein